MSRTMGSNLDYTGVYNLDDENHKYIGCYRFCSKYIHFYPRKGLTVQAVVTEAFNLAQDNKQDVKLFFNNIEIKVSHQNIDEKSAVINNLVRSYFKRKQNTKG